LREVGERETWSTETQEAVSAEVAAVLGITQGLATSHLYYARAMRTRLPRTGALLVAGAHPESAGVAWIVARADRDAVRQRREQQAGRQFSIWESGNGLTEVFGRLITTDAHALDTRLDALADTVCAEDPRTRTQRRADAIGALATAAERLSCQCGRPDCPAGAKPAPGPVLIHVIAEQASLDGTGHTPGSLIGADALIPAELITQLARTAKLSPLVCSADAPPEQGYTPSRPLADFVRCRDLTCRFPGCEAPATRCDLDHTIPYAEGGATHASKVRYW
jgi:hypothetical protein